MGANNSSNNKTQETDINQLNFLKIDQLKRGSHALSLMLKTEDIIVGLNGKTFRGTQKILNQEYFQTGANGKIKCLKNQLG